MHQILATKRYIYMHRIADDIEDGEYIAEDDPCMHCPCYNLGVQEDCLHILWTCPKAAAIWLWVEDLLRRDGGLHSGF
jgi:hypothetical protein